VPEGYLSIGQDYVQFLQWTEDQYGQITGHSQSVRRKNAQTLKVEAVSRDLRGTHNGDDMNLTLGSGNSVLGTLKDDLLTLVVPSSTGELQTIEYRRATIEEYNEAARSFRQQVEQEQQQQQAIQEQEAAHNRLLDEWQAAADHAQGFLDAVSINPVEEWFTERDGGRLASLVRNMQEALSSAKNSQARNDCIGLSSRLVDFNSRLVDLEGLREELDGYVVGFINAVAEMRVKREALGNEAPRYIIESTENIPDLGQPKLDRVKAKADRAEEIARDIEREANSLTCATLTPVQ
jgi:DNA repair exonuclease SbcCD ATPase subunit